MVDWAQNTRLLTYLFYMMRNPQTRELISTQKTLHKHNSKDLSGLQYLSPGMQVNKGT